PRQSELIGDRHHHQRIDNDQPRRRSAHFRGEELDPLGVLVALTKKQIQIKRSPTTTTTAGPTTTTSTTKRSAALARAAALTGTAARRSLRPVDVEADLARHLAQRSIERPDAAERRGSLGRRRRRQRENE